VCMRVCFFQVCEFVDDVLVNSVEVVGHALHICSLFVNADAT
jgi:hypothetical protein